uniref:phosphoenolpyruvate carboxykinase (GTP) n=1 Tax=Ascaris suum TaxID=6253 RepID=F1KZ65_ASCSU
MQDGIEQQHTPSLTTIRSDANEEGIRSLRPLPDDSFSIINEVIISGVGSMPIIKDVTESIAWIATPGKFQTVCRTNDDVVPIMCNWISPAECGKELDSRFPGCMTGRVMYVIPFSLGVICGPFSKIGIELTDSNYTVLCMRIMTRVSPKVFEALGDGDFVRCIHSVGLPRPARRHVTRNWPCNTDLAFLVHRPAEREIWSFGSGFGSNSLLGRKSMALRVASAIARDEAVTDPRRREHFMTAAFPAACGKTSLAMLRPTLAGWKVRCIGAHCF